MAYGQHNYHLYVVRCERRDELQNWLTDCGVSTLIHYPVPVHLQEAYAELGKRAGDYPVAEECAKQALSLPMFPEMSDAEAEYIGSCVNRFS